MKTSQMVTIYLYSRYERFWHWLQTLLILLLLLTGLEVAGLFKLMGFAAAVKVHNTAGITWLVSFAFFVFWVFTTGEWRQYIPTTRKMLAVVRYYAFGIFRGEPHPVPKRKEAKHNPLQRLTYLSLAALLLPLQMTTGLLYWGYNQWAAWGLGGLTLGVLATIHLALAFAILSFIVIHVYMTTTGHNLTAHVKAMITGWEDVEEGLPVEEWERARRKS